jgi:hypothetical protein
VWQLLQSAWPVDVALRVVSAWQSLHRRAPRLRALRAWCGEWQLVHCWSAACGSTCAWQLVQATAMRAAARGRACAVVPAPDGWIG